MPWLPGSYGGNLLEDSTIPIKSKAQRRFLWSTNPAMAQRWEDETPKSKKLPERVSKKSSTKKKRK